MMLGSNGAELKVAATAAAPPPSSSSSSHHHHRQRHQLSRSISELSPIHLHRHHHHHHHHNSSSQHGSHSRRDKRDRASDANRDDLTQYSSRSTAATAGGVVIQPRSSLDVPRSDAGAGAADTPSDTLSPADQSRRTSALIASGDEHTGPADMGGAAANTLYTRKLSREEELQQERRRAVARASGLQKALADLSAFSTKTTRSLDDSYYSVLEKTGALQNTIAALRELAALSQDTSRQFEREADELEGEIRGQVEALGGFAEQEERIQALTARIHEGRDKVRSLSGRVDEVRRRIETWERADREWQERTRRRLKTVWVVMSVVLGLVVVLFVVVQYVPAGEGEGALRGRHGTGDVSAGLARPGVEDIGLEDMLAASVNRTDREMGAVDERLRVFDEL